MLFLLFLQAVQKICLANHIQSIAELLHTDAIQQLEVMLLGSPVACLIDVLLAGLKSTTPTPHQQMVHPSQSLITTPMSPPPPAIPITGITDALVTSGIMTTSSGSKVTISPSHEEMTPSKCQWIFPTPIPKPTMTPRPLSPSCTLLQVHLLPYQL